MATFPRLPVDDDERESLAALPDVDVCQSRSERFYCTMADGHAGDHIAGDSDGMVCARWADPVTVEQVQ